tara:strand:+ start:113 stop:283 length:171 start_codon:yes stop_codon:yes gene_type:complete
MAEKQIRYGAGGKIYYKDVEPEAAPQKDEVISEILTENPNKEDKPKKKKEKKDEEL